MHAVQTTGAFTHPVYDRIFFNKTKMALGGRCRFMLCGGAPILPEVHNFMKIAMCCPLVEGYGQTESTGAGFVTDAYDSQTTHVGGPMVNFLPILGSFLVQTGGHPRNGILEY
jgi:long-chain acyl-CoA synthetase